MVGAFNRNTNYLDVQRIFLVFIIFFILNPFIATIGFLIFSFVTQDKRLALFNVILLSLLMWLIQSTRIFSINEASDWAGNYIINFNSIKTKGFADYIFLTGKEFAWQIENYIGYLIFKRFLPYGNFIVALTYFFTFLSCYVYWKSTGRNVRTLITSLVLFAFISEISMLSNNLLRQQFAMSIMLYVLVFKAVHNKIKWLLLLIAFFTHSMTALFIPFLFINIGIRPSRKMIFLIICGLMFLMLVMRFASSFTDIYVFSRLNTSADYEGVDVMETSAIYPFLVVSIILYLKIVVIDRCYQSFILFINNLFVLLILLCLVFQNMPLVQVRYFITRFFFLPLIIPYFFQQKGNFNFIFMIAVSLFLCILFCMFENHWLVPIEEIFIRSIFEYSIL